MKDLEKDIIKSKAINTLKKIPLFHGLQVEEYPEVLAICHVCRFEKGDVVFEEGDASYQMYVILSGAVTVRSKDNYAVTLQPGEILGEIGLVCNVKRTATVAAADDVILLEINKDDFDLMQGRFPHISAVVMRNIATTLAQRLLKATGHDAGLLL
jgi:CRP/FNR family cyclic AMP-dependent transcriptional regulator